MIVRSEDARRDAITHPIGTGPYRFAGQRADGAVLGRAWAGWRGRPDCPDVVFEFCGTPEEAAHRLLMGNADICHLVPDEMIREIAQTAGFRIEQQPRLAVQLLSIDPRATSGEARRALSDQRVRRALLLALDRGAWVTDLFRGNGMVASQYLHPAILGYDPALSPAPYEPAEARRLLQEAGFGNGFDVVLDCDPAGQPVAAEIARNLAVVGVRAQVRPGEKGGPLLYFAWACSTGDASEFFDFVLRDPSNPRAGAKWGFALRDAGGSLGVAECESDPSKRLALLQQAQRQALEALPLLPLTIRWGSKGVSSRVEVVNRFDEREYVAAFRWRT